jgi:pimeloyl-ACP methyl ester carboxylesterase
MASTNPLEKTYRSSQPSISSTVYPIAGILTTVHGLSELPPDIKDLAVLWLLHPRLQTQASMAPLAAQTIQYWNSHPASTGTKKGLIAVSFDQRNHGSRLIDKSANEAWRQKNPRHAQDMYSIYHGTALDTSLLLSHLPSYLPSHLPPPTQHLVLGVSLGGHAAWHCLLHDPRITAGVVVIGCPDFTRLMLHRAEKSRLESFARRLGFLGSTDFPAALLEAVRDTDPAGLLLPTAMQGPATVADVIPPAAELAERAALLQANLAGKKILNLSGGADKLVPYACGETFLRYLKVAIDPREGWWGTNDGVVFEDRVFDGVGHETTAEMAEVAVTFVGDVLAGGGGDEVERHRRRGSRESRM